MKKVKFLLSLCLIVWFSVNVKAGEKNLYLNLIHPI